MAKRPMTILFSVDGMRPDAMEMASTPIINRLIQQGSHTLSAVTVMPSITLPCHTSMHRGVDTPRHGVTSNVFQPLARPVPSVFDVARRHDKVCAFFANWPELRNLCEPDSLEVAYFLRSSLEQSDDDLIAEAAARHFRDTDFDLAFVYFGHTDSSGHKYGWMSPQYVAAIENADRCIGRVMAAATESSREAIAVVVSDHGGHEQTHGTAMEVDVTIPFVLCGPGIAAGLELPPGVRIFDACPTIAALMNLPADRAWEGRALTEAFVSPVAAD